MNKVKGFAVEAAGYLRSFAEWFAAAVLVGAACGLVGAGFHLGIGFAETMRSAQPWLLYMLPIAGLAIIGVYRALRVGTDVGTSRVIAAIRGKDGVPLALAPAIAAGTFLTHLCGGSAGREGAALQLGGGLGSLAARVMRADEKKAHMLVMCGMAGLFSALFGTPVAAALFVLEISYVGEMLYSALVPCLVSAMSAFLLSTALGVAPVRFALAGAADIGASSLLAAVALGAACALVSIAFCFSLSHAERLLEKKIKNEYARIALGGLAVVALTLLFGTRDYNGAGMDVITRALAGNAAPWAFALKLLLTVVTIAAGFRGGEIVPSFFVGATLGCTLAPLLGMDAGLGAAICMIAMFCGMVNCPAASMLLAVEVFGAQALPLMAIACAVSFMLSGDWGLYSAQNLLFSKINAEYARRGTRQ